VRKLIVAAIVCSVMVFGAVAADIAWDGGAGIWDETETNWGGGTTAWDNFENYQDIALFDSGSGTVTVGEPIDLGGIRVTVGGYTVAESTLRFDTAQGSLGTSALGTSGSNVFTLNSALTGSGELAIASHGNLSDDVPAFYCRGRSRRRAGGNGAGEREVGRIQRSEVRERVERFGMVEIEKVESTQTGEAR
jgi:hypothetical protein